MRIVLPHLWKPRSYQYPLWSELENGRKRAVCVWHRRSGKDITTMNWAAVASQQRVGAYWHIAPTFVQGRRIVWEGIRGDGNRFLDAFPGWRNPGPDKFVTRVRDDLMMVWFKNGSTWQVMGADDPDRLVGPNPVGIVLTEYPIQDPGLWELLRPILLENGGWAIFIYTPRSRNHGWTMYEMAQENPDWFCQRLTVKDTERMAREAGEPVPVSEEDIEAERRAGMDPFLIDQEFYCSFDAPLEGSFYGELMTRIRNENQITRVPYEPSIPVTTAWDIGRSDATAIVFAQIHGHEVRVIDYYSNEGKQMEHFVKKLREKPYVYEDHFAPHDIKVTDYSAKGGLARYEIAKKLGVRFRIVRKLSKEDGRQAVRALIPRCWFNERTTKDLVQALSEHHKVKLPNGTFADYEAKDWTCHPCDAFRYLAVGLRPEKRKEAPPRRAPKLAIV